MKIIVGPGKNITKNNGKILISLNKIIHNVIPYI